jgi:hypothetical protein
LGQLAVLLHALPLELGHLLLHRREGLLDGGKRLEHLALGTLALGASGGLEACALHDVAVLLLCIAQLLAEPRERGLRGRQLGAQLSAQGRESTRMASLQQGRVGVRDTRRASEAREHPPDERAEQQSRGEAEDQGERCIHVSSVAAGSDILGDARRVFGTRDH